MQRDLLPPRLAAAFAGCARRVAATQRRAHDLYSDTGQHGEAIRAQAIAQRSEDLAAHVDRHALILAAAGRTEGEAL